MRRSWYAPDAMRRWGGVLGQALATSSLFGVQIARAESGPVSIREPYHPAGTFVDYAEWTTVGLAVLIPTLIVVARLLSRRRRWFPVVSPLRFASLATLPAFLIATGVFATFEGAKEVEFCESCHQPMELYVSDMKDRESQTLSALHFNNRYIQHEQCYTCHADYGVFGTVEAKLTGLRHMYYWMSGSETARGEKQIGTYSPYRNELCLRCHAGSEKFLQAGGGTHAAIEEELTTTDQETRISCLVCHGPAHATLEQSGRSL
jgi:nitrate/TMAO reductase-like tetraheme cytochrome c subunit